MARSSKASRSWILAAAGLCGLGFAAPASAQYAFDASSPDEQGIKYFGSAKDPSGTIIPGATIVLAIDKASFIYFTDETGRYRGSVPLDTDLAKVATTCSKAGFKFVKFSKRPGPTNNNRPSVQLDCVLKPDTSKVTER